ncbi:MAG: GntR family transcriptional regulator [Gemmatimonadota bacterium]|jgi:GntR family transcriptional regulator
MFEAIDPRRPVPLYEQIATQVRLGVASGEIGAGDALPSVRELARRLRVNPATVVQAYRELETDGFVELRRGAGTFVRDVPAFRREEEMSAQARRIALNAIQDAARAGVSAAELLRAMRESVGAEPGHGHGHDADVGDDAVVEEALP